MTKMSKLRSHLKHHQKGLRSAILWMELLLPFLLFFALNAHLVWLSLITGILIGLGFLLMVLIG